MRFRVLLPALAAIAVAVVLIVVLTGGDEPEGETLRGRPGQGFPLRGSLANDTDAIDGAVSEWREASEPPDEDDEAGQDDPLRDARPDEDDDITVLWAGRADERRDVVIMESARMVAEVTRGSVGAWSVESQRLRDRALERAPIGSGDAVVVPEIGRWRFVNAGFSSGLEDVGDGLFYSDGSDNDGFVVPEAAGEKSVSIYITDVGGRLMRTEEFSELETALAGGSARAVWLAADEANRSLRSGLERFAQVSESPTSTQALELVWTGRIPEHPHAAVVAQGIDYWGRRSAALGFGETPGAEDRREEREDGAKALGYNTSTRRRSNTPDAFVAGAYTPLGGVPYLVLAGSGVETIHALVGDQELERAAPFAVIDARRFVQSEGTPDTVIYGVSADGTVVSPLEAP